MHPLLISIIISLFITAWFKFRYGLTIIAITGSIASGKSSFANYLRQSGQKVFDLDEMAHEVQSPNTSAWRAIVNSFSEGPTEQSPLLVADTLSINREYLAAIVFGDHDKLRKLNQIMRGPIAKKLCCGLLNAFFVEGYRAVYLDAPLLFESGLYRLCDTIVTIECPIQEQISRMRKRYSYDENEAETRLKSQMSQAEKVDRADIVVYNTGSLSDLRYEADKLCHLQKRFVTKVALISFCLILIICSSVMALR